MTLLPAQRLRRRGAPCATVVVVSALSLVSSTLNTTWRAGGGDDAFITYRYAENIARGDGFVFNPGGPAVLGTTTPLYTLILAAGAKLGADIPSFSLTIGAICFSAAVGLLVLLAAELGFLAAGFAAALTWSLSPYSIGSVSGMETPLYMALIVGAFYASTRRATALALALAALAAVTRPDGLALVVAIVALVMAWRQWSWRSAVPGALILVGWIAFAVLVFGSPIPTSGLAKMVHDPLISGSFNLLDSNEVTLLFPIVGALSRNGALAEVPLDRGSLPLAVLVVAALLVVESSIFGVVSFLRHPPARAILLWITLYATGYSVLHLPNFPWYYAPLALMVGLVLWAGMQTMISRVARSPRLGAAVPISLAAGVSVATVALSSPASLTSAQVSPHEQAAEWLHDHALPGQWVVAYEVGTLAYRSELRTVDLLGLTEPQALPYVQRGDYAWALRLQPDYAFIPERTSWPVLTAIYAEPAFTLNYRIVARFPFRKGQDYLLYEHV